MKNLLRFFFGYPEKQYDAPQEWSNVEVKVKKPAGWVFLPRSPDGKLITINDDTGQREAREVLIDAVTKGTGFSLSAERDPENHFDKNAISIHVETPTSTKAHAGFIGRDIAAMVHERYATDMPISAHLNRVRTNGENYFFEIRILVPAAKVRAQFEK